MLGTQTFLTTGGRSRARRSFALSAVLLLALRTPVGAGQAIDAAPVVREERGVYIVTAEFSAPGPASTAIAALTDYENIPRFMPAVKTSRIVERGDGYFLVEQEAQASFMMFSKRIHLALDVREEPGIIRFTDRCGKSFARYDGTWTVSEAEGRTSIVYRLTAKPSFEVPGFLLKRLLKRDAAQMIGNLQAEIAARAARQPST